VEFLSLDDFDKARSRPELLGRLLVCRLVVKRDRTTLKDFGLVEFKSSPVVYVFKQWQTASCNDRVNTKLELID